MREKTKDALTVGIIASIAVGAILLALWPLWLALVAIHFIIKFW